LCFLNLLEELPHFFHLLLNFVPVAHNILKIFRCTILNHLGYHLYIILHDHILWRCSLHLHLLARTPLLSSWSLIQAWFLIIGTWCGPLCDLGLFLLFLGWLCIVLLSLLGPHLSCPFVCLLCFCLARPSFLGHWDFLRLCSFLPYFLLYCLCRYLLGED
jgi:hypothetical protein